MFAAPYTAGELAVLIGQIAAGIGGIIAAIGAVLAAQRAARVAVAVDAVHSEVKTMNAQSIGALVDATETRRVADIPVAERTPSESAHIAHVPPAGSGT